MKIITKRLIAVLCCVAMLVTGLYVSEPRKAEAASSGTMAFTSTETGYRLFDGGDTGYINVDFSINTSIALEPRMYNAFTDDFIDNYMIFEGGMTKEDFKNGFEIAKFATASIMQIRWPGRTEAFETGWSFTIVKGAQIPYNDGTAYVTLDKEYTFTFANGNDTYANVVNITKCNVTTYSLNTTTLVPNGTSDPYLSNINITFADSIALPESSVEINTNDIYADYIDIEGLDFSAFTEAGVKIIAHIGGQAIQINQWGSLRTTMNKGDQIIFREGMPLYFTDTSGNQWKAVLDGTYVYECMYTDDPTHDQVFDGVKINSTNMFGMNTGTETVSAEVGVNYGFAWSAGGNQGMDYVEQNILTPYIMQEYLQVSGCTLDELTTNNNVIIKFIPTANVLQIVVNNLSVLEQGDQILLKKGMPFVWKNRDVHETLCAVLDDDYAFTVKSKSDSGVVIAVTQMGNLSITNMGYSTEYHGDVLYRYDQAFCTYEDAVAMEAQLEQSILKDYVYLSEHSYDDMINAGAYLQIYTAHNMFRLYYQDAKMSLEEGEILIWRKGFPITYTTTSGKAKTVTLDKDYGFRYSASTGFTYDPTLVYEEEEVVPTFTFSVSQFGAGYEAESTDTYIANIGYTAEETITADADVFLLTDERTAPYIDIFGMSAEELQALGIEVKFIPAAEVIQIRLSTTLEWLSKGLQLTFSEGMPIYYQSGGVEKVVQLAETAVYTITDVNTTTDNAHTATFVRYAETAEFALNTDGVMVTSGDCNLGVVNPVTGEQDVLDDMTTGQYVWLNSATINNYIDFCGMTSEEVTNYGIKVALICAGGNEVLQIKWETAAGVLSVGQRLILKAGLPFTYTTTNNMQKMITLDKDYIFEVTAANTTSATLQYTDVLIGGTWGLIFGQEYGTSHGTGEGYYNNLFFSTCDLKEDMFTPEGISTATLSEYVEFGEIAPNTYGTVGIMAIPVLDNANQVIQLRWGSATDSMKAGQEIIFNEGMPIIAVDAEGNRYLYTLDADYTFVLVARDDVEAAANGYVLSGMQKVSDITQGDVDGDYLLNVNDVSLMRKQLVGLVNADTANADANDDDSIDSKDLVRAKLQWDKAEPESYTTVFKKNGDFSTLASAGTVTYTINADVSSANYIRLTFNTTQNLYGTIVYQTAAGADYKENFYVSKDEVQFEQFFDYYRNISPTKNNANEKNAVMKTITFKNVGTGQAMVLLNEVEIANRTDFVTDDMLWIQNDNLKVGADLNMGGSLGYMESLKYNPVEKVSTWSSTTIELNSTGEGPVNLINIYDLGRQIQQAYYIDVKDAEYENGTYNVNYQDVEWPYNPVQAGDKNNNQSQIVDFRVIDTDEDGFNDMIYVKVRALDWAKNGETTESYIENWYRISDNQLYVDNAFVDWAGWKNPGEAKAQELPALYTAQSLSYFVDGDNPSNRTTPGNWASEDPSDYFFEADANVADWYAWVNKDADDAFGVGIYIPGVSQCTAGRPKKLTSNLTSANRNADEAPILDLGYKLYNELYQHEYQNCFLTNTSYIAPGKVVTLQEYRSYEYRYVLTADKLDQMKTAFATISANDTEKNVSLSSW